MYTWQDIQRICDEYGKYLGPGVQYVRLLEIRNGELGVDADYCCNWFEPESVEMQYYFLGNCMIYADGWDEELTLKEFMEF